MADPEHRSSNAMVAGNRTTSLASITIHERETTKTKTIQVRDFIVLTPYPVEPGHELLSIVRIRAADWRTEMQTNAVHIAEGDNAGIIINKKANILDYNRTQAGQKERQQPPSAKMSFKVFLINSATGKLALEHRTLRFWLDQSAINYDNLESDADDYRSTRTFANVKQESSQLAQDYFRQLIGTKPDDDFPKNYAAFIMKVMRLLKIDHFARIVKMEIEMRQSSYEETNKPPSRASSIDGSQSGESGSGRGSPLTSQKVLDIIESSYPNPISIREICSTTQTDEPIVRQFVDELANKEKINSDDGNHYTRTTKPIDTKVNLVKQMPKVTKSQQPVIAIITAQYCEKLAVDSMISDKETFVRYRTTAGQENANASASTTTGNGCEPTSANYVYTLGNIGDHRVVSTKLTSIGHSLGASIAAGSATTRLLGTFPKIEYVFLVGCGGGVVNYTDFSSHVRLGDVVVSHLPFAKPSYDPNTSRCEFNGNKSSSASGEYTYVHCLDRRQQEARNRPNSGEQQRAIASGIPSSYSVHKNLKRVMNGCDNDDNGCNKQNNAEANSSSQSATKATAATASAADGDESAGAGAGTTPTKTTNTSAVANKAIDYEDCNFRLWRPTNLDLQELTDRLWRQGLENPKYRIWEYYIDEGIKALKQQQDIDATRPPPDTDKLFMSIGHKDTIEVSHPDANEDEIDLRKEGRPMCHFGPIGSGRPAALSEQLKQRMISEFGLRAFDSEFGPVVESICGNRTESFIMIRGISDYKDGRKKKEWQQYSALVAAALMKSIIVNLKPLN